MADEEGIARTIITCIAIRRDVAIASQGNYTLAPS